MSQRLRALAALPEDSGLFSKTYMAVQFQEIQQPLLTANGTRHIHGIQTHMQTNAHTHKNLKTSKQTTDSIKLGPFSHLSQEQVKNVMKSLLFCV